MRKRGELTSRQIVIISILIVSFAIILIFFFTLNLKSEISKESCRNSVVLRGTPLGEATRLNCETQDVCISAGGDCKESTDVKIRVKDKDELLDEISDLMYDCHWQMGGNTVDFTPTNLGNDRNYCVICDRIYFDDELKNNGDLNSVTNRELYNYLGKKTTPDGDSSLLFAFYSLSDSDKILSEFADKNPEWKEVGVDDVGSLPIDFGRESGYSLVISQTKEGWGPRLWGIGAGATIGAAIVISPLTGGTSLLTIPGALIVLGTATGGGIAGGIFSEPVGGTVGFVVPGPGRDGAYQPPTLYPNDQKVMESLNCFEFASLA